MSLVTKVDALATAVGDALKSLTADVHNHVGIAWTYPTHFTTTVALASEYLGDWVTRYHLTLGADLEITLPGPPDADHPGRFTIHLKNLGGHTVTLGSTNYVVQAGVNLSETPQPVLDCVWDQVASKWRVGNIAGKASAPALIQQDSADTGRTIYVQFTGDPDPASPVRGDIRVRES